MDHGLLFLAKCLFVSSSITLFLIRLRHTSLCAQIWTKTSSQKKNYIVNVNFTNSKMCRLDDFVPRFRVEELVCARFCARLCPFLCPKDVGRPVEHALRKKLKYFIANRRNRASKKASCVRLSSVTMS